jgi:hypothetical protein
MKVEFGLLKKMNGGMVVSVLIPLFLYWMVLTFKISYVFSRYLSRFSFSLFLLVLLLYYLSFRVRGSYKVLAGFALTMLLFGLALSYKWTSGYSDNGVIGGLLPYKDAKNYYLGANLILNSSPLINAVNATWRPLFPGFISTLLLLTGQNLKIVVASLVGLTGCACYLTTKQIHDTLGAAAASIYGALLFFYVQPFIGFTVSEMSGILFGCFGFLLLWRMAGNLNLFDLVLGLTTLMAAVSARAGAFFIFPFLALWAGWAFRKTKRFSFQVAGIAALTVLGSYLLVNTAYPRLIGIPPGSAFGNFAWELYGQIHGGTGWHRAIEDLGTTNSTIIYRAAFQYFSEHPFSLLIGTAKAYRDFFLPDPNGILAFTFTNAGDWPNLLLWVLTVFLFGWGIVKAVKNIRRGRDALLVASFLGIFFSIPFLPPIDGGGRFYASTIPFLFILPAAAIGQVQDRSDQTSGLRKSAYGTIFLLRSGSLILLVSMVIVPISAYTLHTPFKVDAQVCPSGQNAFAIRLNPGSYIDLISRPTDACGLVPDICLSEFKQNGTDKVDDFYQELLILAQPSRTLTRIIPTVNLKDSKFHYFVVADPGLSFVPVGRVISGCAEEIRTKNQSIYQIESLISP